MTRSTQKQAQEIATECFVVRLRKLNRVISGIYYESFRPFGITTAQFNLLIAIGASGQISPTQLAQSLSLEKSTVSRNIEKMNKNGWVRFVSATDKRRHTLVLTQEGGALLATTSPAWAEAQKKSKKVLGSLANLIEDVSVS